MINSTHDLETAADVEDMVRRFYRAVVQDDLLGPIFTNVARVDWGEHIPKLTLFWCRALFGTRGYTGNPLQEHRRIHAQSEFSIAHFDRWLDLFNQAIDEQWAGPRVEQAKKLAQNVSRVHSTQLLGHATLG